MVVVVVLDVLVVVGSVPTGIVLGGAPSPPELELRFDVAVTL